MIEQNIPVSIDTCGSSYDTEIGVYILVDGDLELLANNDDSSFCTGGTLQSRVIFSFEAGVTYFIVVDGFNSGSCGSFNLNIDILPSPSPPPPAPPPFPPFPPGFVSLFDTVCRASRLTVSSAVRTGCLRD